VNSGEYAVRHNPFVYFDSVRDNLNYCTNHVRPYSELARDLASNTVPRFVFISPNTTNDMHDTAPGSPSSRKQGDDWLSREVPRLLASAAYTNNGALFITWDEGSSDGDGPIGMIVLSPRARGGGYHTDRVYTHSSWLRTAQDIFHLRPYLADAAYASNLGDLFKTIRLTPTAWDVNGLHVRVTNLVPGETNYLQVAPNPFAGPWLDLQTNIASSAVEDLTIPSAGPNEARFFRVVE
jgi:hypothetical protein